MSWPPLRAIAVTDPLPGTDEDANVTLVKLIVCGLPVCATPVVLSIPPAIPLLYDTSNTAPAGNPVYVIGISN